MMTMRLDLATVMRRTHATALIALSCATLALPAIARADDASDKGSTSSSSGQSNGSKDDATGHEAKGPEVESQHRGPTGLLAMLGSGSLVATQFHSSNATVSSSALASPAVHTPELGNPHAPIVNPEPGTVALLAAGLGAVGFAGYRRRKQG